MIYVHLTRTQVVYEQPVVQEDQVKPMSKGKVVAAIQDYSWLHIEGVREVSIPAPSSHSHKQLGLPNEHDVLICEAIDTQSRW